MQTSPVRLMAIPVIVVLLATAACGAEADPGGSPVGVTTATTAPSTTAPSTTAPSTTAPETTAPPTTAAPTTAPETMPPGPETIPPGRVRYDPDTARAELEAARTRWADQGWQSYRFAYTPICFCPRSEIEVEVIDGRVVNGAGDGRVLSIEGWFDEIDAAIGTASDIRADYDESGYPTALYIDVDELMADEEFGFEFVGFGHVPDAIEDFMTDDYGCGFGFWVATPDQTASFIVSIDAITDYDIGPQPGTYDLAGQSGEVRFGTDLMANWCDDVIEEGEPEADIIDTWTVVGGRLELTLVDDSAASATLRDVVALTSTGAEYPLGDVTITNDMWGFFAG